MTETSNENQSAVLNQTKFEEMRESAVRTIRCLSAVPVDLENLLAEIEREEAGKN